ncbi:dienelactone hydrolase endo-1,3,1,4-beta-D-glucanase [Mycena maculata]|uniref:Dienelactone hydrolase endo-1,3,1,4-beta-D-glucanase n=1 Tax=Mycena maculata TaxID=230809 RepID=A0AAD7I3W5_9AGAR|nr:dienelactone hydrolase endo-1,3,1,4-beta-D-glucanase [Mycena maculata]
MSFCNDYFKGVTHEGTPKGRTEKIGGIECYIATPSVEYPKDKVIIFLTDVFGLGLKNSLLLADDFSRNGFRTIVPDMFNGDPYPVNALEPGAPPFDREKWWPHHGQAQTRPLIDSVIAALKLEGVTGFAATGYCYGARYVFDLAFDGIIQASAISHPGRLVVPDDLDKYAAVCKAPLLINSCEDDRAFPLEAQAQADLIFGGGKFAPGLLVIFPVHIREETQTCRCGGACCRIE